MKTLILVVALSLCACTTQKRTKANLAIDSDPSDTPASVNEDTTAAGEDSPPEGEIDLGIEGSSGPVKVEGAMSAEDEDAALASSEPAKKDGKKDAKKDGDKKDDKKKPADDEEEEEEEENVTQDVELSSE